MTRYNIIFEAPSAEVALSVIDEVIALYDDVALVRVPVAELTDDETAADIAVMAARSANPDALAHLEALEALITAGEPPPEADPTPPHGIERPTRAEYLTPATQREFSEKVLTGGHPYTRQGDYWVDESKHYVSGSMTHPILDVITVQCQTCGAGIGERCITSNHVGYRDGFAHTARRHVFEARHTDRSAVVLTGWLRATASRPPANLHSHG